MKAPREPEPPGRWQEDRRGWHHFASLFFLCPRLGKPPVKPDGLKQPSITCGITFPAGVRDVITLVANPGGIEVPLALKALPQ